MWTASVTRAGYGRFQIAGSTFGAHRIVYWLTTRRDPLELLVCHTCDVPACCRPDHLFLGTHKDNMADKLQKGRVPFGEGSGRAILTEDNVREIRTSPDTIPDLSVRFDTSIENVRHIQKRISWKHVA